MNIFNFEKALSAIPSDHCDQSSAIKMIAEALPSGRKINTICDLGCGTGHRADWFKENYKYASYVGVDIESSPEVDKRTRSDVEFRTYDGITLPFDDKDVDVFFMDQVLEHVRQPHLLLPEIVRCLKYDGVLVGSVSQLEPYHSYSIFNYTFYGICSFFDLFGLEVFKLRPGIDSQTLISRTINKFIFARDSSFENMFFMNESPLNYALAVWSKQKKCSIRATNLAKLKVAGHICFAAKPKL